MDNGSCWERYSDSLYSVLTGVRVSLSFLGCIFTVVMLIIIFLWERYKFFTQRLSLYLVISALSASLTGTLDLSPSSSYTSTSGLHYCQFIAFFEVTTLWWYNLSTAAIMIVVFIEVVPKKSTAKLEPLFVAIIFLFPLTFTWIPYITSHYGALEYFCWITPIDIYNNCTVDRVGIALNTLIYYGPTYIIISIIAVLLIIAFTRLRKRKRIVRVGYQRNNSKMINKQLLIEIHPLMLYPLIMIIVNIIGLLKIIGSIVTAPLIIQFILSLSSLTAFRLQWIAITLVYTLEIRKSLTKRNIKKSAERCLLCCKREHQVMEYPMAMGRSDSRREPVYHNAADILS